MERQPWFWVRCLKITNTSFQLYSVQGQLKSLEVLLLSDISFFNYSKSGRIKK